MNPAEITKALSESHQPLATLVTAISAGVVLMVIARWLKLPAIVLLLAAGMLLGPEGLGIVRPQSLGAVFPVFVSLAVGIILFEGGLTLDLEGYKSASKLIRRLLSFGVLITWLLTAVALIAICRLPPAVALLGGSLVIVTGPTVISPLLKRIRITRKLHSILTWEGVLIDPIGVFVAVLCYEWIARGSGGTAFANFSLRLLTGLTFGGIGGISLWYVLRSRRVPQEMIGITMLAGAVLVFGVSEILLSESGLLSAVIAGLVLAARTPLELKQIRKFKAEIADLLIAGLFILLASRLQVSQFRSFGWDGFAVVGLVVFLIRPLNIFACSFGQDLDWREKTFLSWIAPRGIVAASLASLFRIQLETLERPIQPLFSALASLVGITVDPSARTSAAFIETFAYSVIIATIVLHGLSAGVLARVLGLRRPSPTGWCIVGAHRLARELAAAIVTHTKLPVILMDTDREAIEAAKTQGLPAVCADARSAEIVQHRDLDYVANVFAVTSNEDLNAVICDRWQEIVGTNQVYRWQSRRSRARGEVFTTGRVAWGVIPKPGFMSEQVNSGKLVVAVVPKPEEFSDIPLALITQGKVLLDQLEWQQAGNNETMYLVVRRTPRLSVPLLQNESQG